MITIEPVADWTKSTVTVGYDPKTDTVVYLNEAGEVIDTHCLTKEDKDGNIGADKG